MILCLTPNNLFVESVALGVPKDVQLIISFETTPRSDAESYYSETSQGRNVSLLS